MMLDETSRQNFTSALEKYAAERKIDNAEACNRAAYQVAWRAIAHTSHANSPAVESQLGQIVGHALTFTKRGKISKSIRSRKAGIVSTKSLAYNIMAARIFRKVGKGGMPRSVEIQASAYKMVRKRVASVSFILAGWIPAIRRLQSVVQNAFYHVPRDRAGKGGVRIATAGHNVFAEITNSSVNPKSRSSEEALFRVGGAGLAQAVDEELEDMLAYVQKQLDQRAAEFNAH